MIKQIKTLRVYKKYNYKKNKKKKKDNIKEC